MTAAIAPLECIESELVDDSSKFFAPVDSDVIDSLLGRYESELDKVQRIAEVMNSAEYRGAVSYYLGAAETDSRSSLNVEKFFSLSGAKFQMNARYWRDALALTDVYDCMPQARRDYWNAQIRGEKHIGNSYNAEKIPPLPDFLEDTVRNTLADLLRQRSVFFAERVDGIFRNLSGDHVTNQPQGFSTRMIVGYMLSYGSIRHERSGLINDLRCVIAKFMGRDEPKHTSSDILVAEMYKCTGQWVTVDGGTLRIRVYKKGTAHLEVHPDMAWRLNQVLASLHPRAIPAEFRVKQKKKAKEFVMMGRPLPFEVLELIGAGLRGRRRDEPKNIFAFGLYVKDKAVYQQAFSVLEALGGVQKKDVGFEFDYPFEDVLRDLCISGCLPDQMAHQYYPTPAKLASIAVELAAIVPGDTVLEPSAGQGGIADHLPKDQTTCVEISHLHCEVLKAKGHQVVKSDFLEFTGSFDVVVMNPPFSEGRAKAHTLHASTMVNAGGRLVAILPASMKGKDFLPGFSCEWSSVYAGEFAGTSAAVVILLGVRP